MHNIIEIKSIKNRIYQQNKNFIDALQKYLTSQFIYLKNRTLKIPRADGIKIYDTINTLSELIFFIIIDKYKNFFICRMEKNRMEKKWMKPRKT